MTPRGTRGAKAPPSGVLGRGIMRVAQFVHRRDHPAWYYNPARHPDRGTIEVQGRKTTAVPHTLTGDERAAAWARITREQPRYAGCQEKTDRQIPVVRLIAR